MAIVVGSPFIAFARLCWLLMFPKIRCRDMLQKDAKEAFLTLSSWLRSPTEEALGFRGTKEAVRTDPCRPKIVVPKDEIFSLEYD